MEPVLELPPDAAHVLSEAIQMELESTISMIQDEGIGRKNPALDGWSSTFLFIESLASIPQVEEPGQDLALDYDQAYSAAEVIMTALETAEDMEGVIDPSELRNVGRYFTAAGFSISQVYGDGYQIELASEENELDNQTAYWALSPEGRVIGTAMTINGAWNQIRAHQGPPVGSQISLDLESPNV